MHFNVFINVKVPHAKAEPEVDSAIAKRLRELETDNSISARWERGHLCTASNVFGRNLIAKVETYMAPYDAETENTEYLEFCDQTEEVLSAYKNSPDKNRYKTFEDFAYLHGYRECETPGRYGWYENPNGICDYYSIGSHWANVFLVKNSCAEYCVGEREDGIVIPATVPEGYRWVSAARKCDIEWSAAFLSRREEKIKEYYEFVKCFNEQRVPVGGGYKLTEDGINSFQDKVYIVGESLEDFLTRNRYGDGAKPYPIPCGFISDGCYHDDCKEDELADYIESIPPDDVIVCLDCHI